jgi:hypothetical protein
MPGQLRATRYEVRATRHCKRIYFVARSSYLVLILAFFFDPYSMKTIFLPFIVFIVVAFGAQQYSGSIRGKVLPHQAALHVWAVSNGDTGRAVLQNGEFEIRNLRPGRYLIIVGARLPYKTTIKPDVIVNDSSNTDVGDIRLDQR